MKNKKRAKRLARQLFHLCLVDSLLDEDRALQIVQRVVDTRRRDCTAILAYFLRLVQFDHARRAANIESAMPLPTDLQTNIQASLYHRYGRSLTTNFILSPSLIGGVRIQVGSDLYDASILARLAAFEKNF